MSDFNAKMHQNRFRLGLRPRPRWGSLQRYPDPLAGFKGPTTKGMGGKGRPGMGGGLGWSPPCEILNTPLIALPRADPLAGGRGFAPSQRTARLILAFGLDFRRFRLAPKRKSSLRLFSITVNTDLNEHKNVEKSKGQHIQISVRHTVGAVHVTAGRVL